LIAVVESSAGGIAQLLSAIAQLLWPVVALLLAYWLLSELKQIFHRISQSKNLTVKWGDKELSIQEAADNIQRVVGSLLDTEAASGSKQVNSSPPGAWLPQESKLSEVQRIAAASLPRRILWVDDRPEGNALEMARLQDRGIQIDETVSTEEALRFFEPGKYALVVTDMFR
jgi:hypothetical protein